MQLPRNLCVAREQWQDIRERHFISRRKSSDTEGMPPRQHHQAPSSSREGKEKLEERAARTEGIRSYLRASSCYQGTLMLPWGGLVSSSKTPLLALCMHLSLEEVSLLPSSRALCSFPSTRTCAEVSVTHPRKSYHTALHQEGLASQITSSCL